MSDTSMQERLARIETQMADIKEDANESKNNTKDISYKLDKLLEQRAICYAKMAANETAIKAADKRVSGWIKISLAIMGAAVTVLSIVIGLVA